ncbi:hypothetical protein [Parabacteroides distasonis]|uniref:hypothetical protein n=1 Tax=Parabacteroides distasonis TaxID=823 RepID=UPI00189F36E3|nr:hypothetical protein [Parabacteroides distasonis]MDB9150119.1 hypothetical protein [Parabacteroides distasonis]MDB9154514.1 hypothetical protein [Parabacteroides distasonis]MDB9163519.1 hypothetical protein [Parabacteroides distasonis]MDB9168334.1 hypothetical protein [Parabacteroides distasonis]MDB9194654.1 hypothetical protein [Parabacteroides distasonis]
MEHEEENIRWEDISRVMREGKNPSGAQKSVEPSRTPPSKIYESLYEELLDKCNPLRFMEPYDKEKVDVAIVIYGDLSNVDKEDEECIRAIRDRAMRELGISISTDMLYKKLIDYCNPQNFFNESSYQADLLQVANHFYALIKANRNDIHELEKLSSQVLGNRELSLFYARQKEEEEKERVRVEEEKKKKEREFRRETIYFWIILLFLVLVVALLGYF